MEEKDQVVRQNGPLTLVNFHKPWGANFTDKFDVFVDTFSNFLILHNDGKFYIWEEFRRNKEKQTGEPFFMHLRAKYQTLQACAMHPTK
jgi:hypothetical protein